MSTDVSYHFCGLPVENPWPEPGHEEPSDRPRLMVILQIVRSVLFKNFKRDFPGGAVVKNLPANAGDTSSSPGPGRSHMPWSN